jgi:alanine racemase
MINVSGVNEVKVGDEVTIFSAAPGNTIADMAAVLGTIPYEVMTSISARVKRIYTKE